MGFTVDAFDHGDRENARRRSFTSTVYAPRGSAVNGIEWSDVEAKFNTLCPLAGISTPNIERCTRVLRHFRDVQHMRELVEQIR